MIVFNVLIFFPLFNQIRVPLPDASRRHRCVISLAIRRWAQTPIMPLCACLSETLILTLYHCVASPLSPLFLPRGRGYFLTTWQREIRANVPGRFRYFAPTPIGQQTSTDIVLLRVKKKERNYDKVSDFFPTKFNLQRIDEWAEVGIYEWCLLNVFVCLFYLW